MIIHSALATEGSISSLVHKTGVIKDSVILAGEISLLNTSHTPSKIQKKESKSKTGETVHLWEALLTTQRNYFFTNALCHIQYTSVQPLKSILMEVSE